MVFQMIWNFVPSLSSSSFIRLVAICSIHVLIGSLFFDFVHWLAHNSHRSSFRALRWIAQAHSVHHRFFDRNLQFNDAFRQQNILYHLTLELLCQVAGSTFSWLLSRLLVAESAQTCKQDLTLVLAFQVVRACVAAWNSGRDSNHISYSKLPKDPWFLLVGPQYHVLHHVDPQNYFGSLTRLADWLLGTSFTFRGRRVAITGYGGALGRALADQLRREGVALIKPIRMGIEWTFDDYSKLESILADIDILILAHGSKDSKAAFQANCTSATAIIDIFRRSCSKSKLGLLPEVWYVGSEAEFHGSWARHMQHYTDSKRAFVPFARAYYEDDAFNYRHIVPAAFRSPMGPALVSALWTARVAIWWIRRGSRYVPVTYTGFAYLNYFRFMYWVKPCFRHSAPHGSKI